LTASRLAALIPAIFLVLVTHVTASAEPPAVPYVDAVQQASDILHGASGSDTAPATAALRVLLAGTGSSQREIIADLTARPPLYDDARNRLSALLNALHEPVRSSDPEVAQRRLHEVMSMSRYDALHRPPSPLERLTQWIQDRMRALLRLLFGQRAGGQSLDWWIYLAGIVVVAAVAFVVFRASRGRFSESINLSSDGPRPPADYFAEADRLAAVGDRVGAIRALCAAVAATLAGERSWEGSPLTVREMFQRAPDHGDLRALLLPFEAAVYGGREVDAATYMKAERVAARYRREPARAAA
jgi:hypothetical protein